MSVIDLRSDTVTLPTPAMKQAMAEAELGDDVYGEDPTVNRLQALAAEKLGKEAALFVASGTMGNLISLLVHAPRGSEVILGDQSHIYNYEQGGASALGGLVFHPVRTESTGELPIGELEKSFRDKTNDHCAPAGVICLENTHNWRGGVVLGLDYLEAVRKLANREAVPLHLDGARLANAAVALGVGMHDIAAHFDSVQLDLSKGLCAPVGGLVAGSAEFIRQAKRVRKMLGGGMRQAGVIAAAGIIALDEMVDRLEEDHRHARLLAEALNEMPEVVVDLGSVQTNIVIFGLSLPGADTGAFIRDMREQGVLLGKIGHGKLRFVTHNDISEADVRAAIQAVKAVLAGSLAKA